MSCEFRIQSARVPQMSGDAVRCPLCRRIEWFWDGLVLLEREDGTLLADRVEPRRTRHDDWSCMACGYEAPQWSTTTRLLAKLAVAARWSIAELRPQGGERAAAS